MPLRALQSSYKTISSVSNTLLSLKNLPVFWGSKLGSIGQAFYGITRATSFGSRRNRTSTTPGALRSLFSSVNETFSLVTADAVVEDVQPIMLWLTGGDIHCRHFLNSPKDSFSEGCGRNCLIAKIIYRSNQHCFSCILLQVGYIDKIHNFTDGIVHLCSTTFFHYPFLNTLFAAGYAVDCHFQFEVMDKALLPEHNYTRG